MKFSTFRFILFLLIGYHAAIAQADSTWQQNTKHPPRTIGEFVFPPHKQSKPYTPKPFVVRRNSVTFQLLGDTPFLGIRYDRRVLTLLSDKLFVEAGGGVGFAPHLFSDFKNVVNFSFTHHTAVVVARSKQPSRFVSPVVGYSGIWYSNAFYNSKRMNYIPSPYLGFRLGNPHGVAFNAGWQMYVYGETSYELTADEKIKVLDKKYGVGAPAFGLHFSF